FGIHVGTGQPYAWPRGCPGEKIKHEDLPYISADEARGLVDDIAEMLVRDHGYVRAVSNSNGHANGHTERGPVTDVDAELAQIVDEASANDVQCRIIGHLVNCAEHPDDILERVVDATMAASERRVLGWTRETEVGEASERIKNILNSRIKDSD